MYGPWVFAGEWGEEGFVADPDGRLWPDDEGAEPFAEEERHGRIVIQLPESPEVLLERRMITPRAR